MRRSVRASRPRPVVRARLVCTAIAVSVLVPSSSVHLVPARPGTTFAVMQLNLCNSGMATSCYSFDRAVGEAAAKLRRYGPDLVTVQEICYGDLYGPGSLGQAMADRHGREHVSVAFTPAGDRATDGPYRCVDGEPFGIALLHHGDGRDVHRGRYDSQDSTGELRVWMCTTVFAGRLTGCTTHLSTDPDVAVRQCHELMSILESPWVLPGVVVAGDLNLTSRAAALPTVQDCASAGYGRRSDQAVQHVLFSPKVRSLGGTVEGMRWTDHPLLYGTFEV